MDLNEYHELAQRTCNDALTLEEKQKNGLYGIVGEAGEVMDLYKKHYFQGHSLDPIEVAEELGDIMWYIVELCSGLNIKLEDVARHNIKKLRGRYPEGFDREKSVNR